MKLSPRRGHAVTDGGIIDLLVRELRSHQFGETRLTIGPVNPNISTQEATHEIAAAYANVYRGYDETDPKLDAYGFAQWVIHHAEVPITESPLRGVPLSGILPAGSLALVQVFLQGHSPTDAAVIL